MLPGEDGLALAQRLRAQTHAGIIMLTALGNIENRLAGLDLADAYLVKPVDLRELSAVIRSVHRRVHRAHSGDAPLLAPGNAAAGNGFAFRPPH